MNGEAPVVIPPANTSSLAATTHKLVYDLQLTSGATVHKESAQKCTKLLVHFRRRPYNLLILMELLERETRIELATNSLEECVSIANKVLQRSWRAILTTDTH